MGWDRSWAFKQSALKVDDVREKAEQIASHYVGVGVIVEEEAKEGEEERYDAEEEEYVCMYVCMYICM